MRGNGERIGPQNLPTSSVAGGIWNLLNQQRAQQRGAWPSATPAVVTDPYFMYVPLLLNTTSTNAQQNNTFLDSSSNAFTITRNGTPTQGAFTPYQPSGYWSGIFNGSTDYLNFGNQTALHLGSGNFTIESWIWKSANSQYMTLCGDLLTVGSNTFQIIADVSGTKIGFFSGVGAGAFIITSSASIPLNSWMHIAFVRNSGTLTLYINGVLDSSATLSTDFNATTSFFVAHTPELISSRHWNGYISNFRVVKGTAVYTSAFTPPTTPLTAITNTSLLTLQSNRFIDNSSNAFAITANGTPKVQAFQPFAPAASYDAATYGGSGYFNASSSYLSIATPTATNISANTNFTIEGWIYPIAHTNTAPCIFNNYTNSGLSGVLALFAGHNAFGSTTYNINLNGTIVNGGTIVYNQWSHFAIVRNGTGSSNVVLYINGVSVGTSTSNAALSYNGGLFLGTAGDSTANSSFNGYISNFRWNNSTAIYTAAFTPPTTPLTAVSGTSLLTNFTNAGIYDAAWQNNVTTVGDAQASTTITAKWPPTSMKFDGTGDGLKGTVTTNVTPVSGDFTWEGWVYFNTLASAQCLIGVGNSQDRTILYFDNSTGLTYVVARSGANQILASQGSTSGWATGTWYYFAVTRSGNVYTVYRNGTSIATVTSAYVQSDLGQPMTVGYSDWSTSNLYLNGYIQDLRITKGVARTITTPTAAFPTR